MRSFIAVEIPSELKQRLAHLQREFEEYRPDIRWVKPESIHLTLKFLGEVRDDYVDVIVEGLREIIEGKYPFSLRVCGIGVFPNHKRPRVLWAGVDTCEELISIQEAIEDKMELLGFSREEREFRPHLTIGRFRSARSNIGLMRAIDSYRDAELGYFDVDFISLMRSDLRPDGAVYTRIAGIKLEKE